MIINLLGDKIGQPMIHQIKGLVFTGGESTRMGVDKSGINYHGTSQMDYLYEMLQELLGSVYVSCHPDRIPPGERNIITDIMPGMGPLSGLLAAFERHPGHAWLAVACDLPFLNKEAVKYLADQRDASKLATCFHDPSSGMPEPMIAIWEPAVYPYLTDQSKKGMSLRKVLLQPEVLQIQPLDPGILINANTHQEMMDVKKKMQP